MIEKVESSPDAHYHLKCSLTKALVYYNAGEHEKCIETLTNYQNMNDDIKVSEENQHAIHLLLGKAYFSTNDFDKAQLALYKAKDVASGSEN
mmetsp:Transcript_26694/g.25730  ORF Transcript_26694/g.25730 Transcript_26694/m.25730 type:complete len:92 (+) Transcript_26694:92-367(+)|eukprot:CAMPEP_0170551222 /NCGR_PEP_ID=MMETSP0211-20121228/9255_1 /TAXON_ID=311385 /ORGANISM="Pseudokeronopsis sp., Strain OXSARD2" /LENGTH=91 /DNA_ID=CAMNT_0010858285 /DNA_START=88 /DNA_END=363 /DNA_ORIENTATION=+